MKRYLFQAGKPALALFGILIALLFCAFVSIYLTVTSPVQSVFYHDSKIQALQGTIFPRLTVVMTNKEWGKEVFSSPYVVALFHDRHKILIDSLNCTPHPACLIQSWEISQHEREVFGEILQKLPKYLQLQYDEMQWNRDADAINYILSVYGEGHDPRYPKIDSASVDVTTKYFSNLIMGIQTKLLNDSFQRNGLADPFFKDALVSAVFLLDANDRMDAVRFSGLWNTLNAPSLGFACHLNWKNYPYTAIIVPGEGPEDPHTQLSALGKFRLTLAVESFNRQLAPFIIVSGGAVHPAHTDFVEAAEMRHFLIERFHIPERNIVIEPYARHTTTNLRNASRYLQIIGAPQNKPALIVTDPRQGDYISSSAFFNRNKAELKCEPGAIGQKITAFSTIFIPNNDCNLIDPWDPLDP
ncbi:YdcF family protein [Gluconobacter wancherniae]|uniref:YdcF family protein n=1 Tax=Gluconobacter wancherniae TaxID=1307955 RepID=UPI001B8B9E49|nr:YdcF family protein [Gluconobacter wancherniae]MBS1064170.1 YdcF family protein [Gluconobacter wancherniae]